MDKSSGNEGRLRYGEDVRRQTQPASQHRQRQQPGDAISSRDGREESQRGREKGRRVAGSKRVVGWPGAGDAHALVSHARGNGGGIQSAGFFSRAVGWISTNNRLHAEYRRLSAWKRVSSRFRESWMKLLQARVRANHGGT